MAAGKTEGRPIYCDGCLQVATAKHLHDRIVCLEWASRFRPIRIGTLFLMPAPPVAMEDYFYCPERQPSSPDSRALYDDLMEACGIAPGGAGGREAALREFQQTGYFLAYCVECPVQFTHSGGEEWNGLLERLAPTLERRIRFSFRPKAILPVSDWLKGVAGALGSFGVDAGVLTQDGKPISIPPASDVDGRSRFRTEMVSLLTGSGAQSA